MDMGIIPGCLQALNSEFVLHQSPLLCHSVAGRGAIGGQGRPSLFPFARESEFDSAWTTGMHQGEKYKNRHERRRFVPIVDAAGTHGFRRHDPGLTFASRLALAGVDLGTVHELLGHRSWEATCPTPTWLPNHQMATVERLVSIQAGTPTGEATDTKTCTSLPGQRSSRPSDL